MTTCPVPTPEKPLALRRFNGAVIGVDAAGGGCKEGRWFSSTATGTGSWTQDCVGWLPLPATLPPGPITDPTQGVVMVGIDHAVPGSERTMETTIDHTGAVVACRERPSCIPADCQHFEQLPSGLWAWVESPDTIRVENRTGDGTDEAPVIHESYRTRPLRGHLDVDNFLAARALGVRVLGWAR